MARLTGFVLCVDNQGYQASLIVGKVYPRLSDPEAEKRGLVRVLDEDAQDEEGYLYPQHLFWPVELPEDVQRAILAAQ